MAKLNAAVIITKLMTEDKKVTAFLSQYDPVVYDTALYLRQIILTKLPGITELVDLPAKMIAYCYGQKYIEMICTIIPSKKGIKLGFYKGVDLPDPGHLLQGTGKISRYLEIKPGEPVSSSAVKGLLKAALAAHKQRMNK
jgi:hypothetical protein